MALLPNKTVGQRIRIAREYLSAERRQRVTQDALAEMCGWGQARIGNYERDIRSPRPKEIQIIAEVTGCRAEWIQFGTGPMHAYQEGMIAGSKGIVKKNGLLEAFSECHPQRIREENAAEYEQTKNRITSRIDDSVLKMLPSRYRAMIETMEWLTDEDLTEVMRIAEAKKQKNKQVVDEVAPRQRQAG